MANFINMKRYLLFAAFALSAIVFAMAFVEKETAHPDKHLEIVLRTIGHQVLLHANDSTSRVLPVKKVNDDTYQISFENSFGFTPDTLMNLVHQQLAKTDKTGGYIVSVNECDENQTIFAYEVNKTRGDLIPCRGREQEKGCYTIEITFLARASFRYAWLLLALVPVAFGGFYLARKPKRDSSASDQAEERVDEPLIGEKPDKSLANEAERIPTTDYKKLGNFEFSETKGILSLNGEATDLSPNEVKALSLLTSNKNEVVGRDLLMKKIWEDDGILVITRNVDVLISKLRKRLSADPSVKILTVHGKGYKMIA